MLTDIDTTLFYYINNFFHSEILDTIMLLITSFGGGAVIFIIAAGMLFFRERNVKISGVLLIAGLTFTYYIVSFLKELIERPRPFLALTDVNTVLASSGFSFPSSHTATAVMAAAVLSRYFGKGYVFYTIALLVAVSRVYLGVHYPLDVICGGCVGWFIGKILISVSEKF